MRKEGTTPNTQIKLDKDCTSHIVTEIRFNKQNPEIVEMVVDVLGTDAGRFINAILKGIIYLTPESLKILHRMPMNWLRQLR